MPKGLYAHFDPHEGHLVALEQFSCAPGPAGWRYVSELLAADGETRQGSVDLAVDTWWRQVRLEVREGDLALRGGVSGREVLWVRSATTSEQGSEHAQQAVGFTGRSPAFLVTLPRLLQLDPGEQVKVGLVEITEPALGAMRVERGIACAEVSTHETETEPLRVERYEVTDLATGEQRTVHLAGDVVVHAPALELRDLQGRPNQ